MKAMNAYSLMQKSSLPGDRQMKNIAVIYHSAHGHTEHIARHVAEGARSTPDTDVRLVRAEEVTSQPNSLLEFDGFLLGSPTYLGGVSGTFKNFMDSTGGLWRTQRLKGKLAAGFTVSSLPAGDKQSTLISLFTFCMQHGMLWLGNPILPEQHRGVPYDEAANRLGSWSGLMAQAGHSAAADAFVAGDIKTARMFGRNFAETAHRISNETQNLSGCVILRPDVLVPARRLGDRAVCNDAIEVLRKRLQSSISPISFNTS